MRKHSHPLIFLAGTTLMAAAVLYASDIVTSLPAGSMVAVDHVSLPRLRLAQTEDRTTDAAQPNSDIPSRTSPAVSCAHSASECRPTGTQASKLGAH